MYPNGTCKYIKYNNKSVNESARLGQQAIILVLLCLMAMDFQTRFFYFAFALLAVVILFQRMEFELPQAVLPALVLAVSMCLFSPTTKGWALGMVRPFAYPLCVITGYNIIDTYDKEKAEKQLIWIIIALAIGSFSHYFLNMVFNWGKSVDRNTIDFWTRSILSATGQSSLACLMVGVSIPILFSDVKKIYKIIFAAFLMSIMYYNLMLGGRTLFVLIIILLVVNLVSEWKKNRHSNTRIKIFFLLLLFVVLLFTAISFNLFGIVDVFYKSNFFVRFHMKRGGESLTDDGRMTYKLLYLKNMLNYPFGGKELYKAIGRHYAHDIFLDTYSDSGVFAFISMIIMVGCFTVRSVKLYFNQQINYLAKKLLINVTIIMIAVFCMEPILDATPWLFASFCILYGCVAKKMEYHNTTIRSSKCE